MTDKEFKRLSRSQLIEIIYQLQIKQEELTKENEKLQQALSDRRIHVEATGNIAEAALGIYNVMQSAQSAAEHYLEEIRLRTNEEQQRILQGAKDEAAAILERAKQDAAEIVGKANNAGSDCDPAADAVLEECQQPM